MKTVPKLFVTCLLFASAASALAAVHYVDVNSTNATPPYTNWTTAATNIQEAVDAAVAGDEIVVTNGTYHPVAVDKPLNIRSVNGPQFTTIDGAYSGRCASGATLFGFTLTKGVASYGGGAYDCTLNNCTLNGNQVHGSWIQFEFVPGYGGGAYGCLMTNCTLTSNSVSLNPCFSGPCSSSRYDSYGGGAAYCQLDNCTLTSNSAIVDNVPCCTTYYAQGGGAAFSTLNNCALSGNLVSVKGPWLGDSYAFGGGAYNCTLNNCTLSGNSANLPDYSYNREYAEGGGAYNCTLNNCTLNGNLAGVTSYRLGRSGASGGGARGGTLNNCISFTNFQFSYWSNDFSCADCGSPGSAVDGNWRGNPLFVDLSAGNLRLQSNSPCINAGNNVYVPAGPDLDGNPRISGGTADIGAYEFQFPLPLLTIVPSGTNLILAWPTNYAEVVIQGDQYEAYFLYSTTNLTSPALWSFVYSLPVVANGQFVVTNSLDGAQRFYRVIKTTGPTNDIPCLWNGPNPCPCAYQCVSSVWTHYASCRTCDEF